jgi:hypothetical protein
VTLLQQRDHIGVRKLPKFRVMRSDGEKRARGAQANDLVDLLSQLLKRVLGCDRDREDDLPGSGRTVWTIAPDCSFKIARQIGLKILDPHKQGRLTAEQQARLKDVLDRVAVADLAKQFGAGSQVNARRITLFYGGKESVLTLAPGGGDLGALRAAAAEAWRLRPCLRRIAAAVNLPFVRRGAASVGAQHRGDGGDQMVDHLSEPVRKRPPAQRKDIIGETAASFDVAATASHGWMRR